MRCRHSDCRPVEGGGNAIDFSGNQNNQSALFPSLYVMSCLDKRPRSSMRFHSSASLFLLLASLCLSRMQKMVNYPLHTTVRPIRMNAMDILDGTVV